MTGWKATAPVIHVIVTRAYKPMPHSRYHSSEYTDSWQSIQQDMQMMVSEKTLPSCPRRAIRECGCNGHVFVKRTRTGNDLPPEVESIT